MWRQTQKVSAFLQICIQFHKQYFQTRLFSAFLHSWFERGVKKLAYSQINHLLSYMWTCNSEIMIEELNKCQLYGSHIKILTIFFILVTFIFTHGWIICSSSSWHWFQVTQKQNFSRNPVEKFDGLTDLQQKSSVVVFFTTKEGANQPQTQR